MTTVSEKQGSMYGHRELAYAWQPWVVVLSAALFFFYEFIQMNMFNAITPSLMQAFSVTATRLGNLSATYFYANVLFLFLSGIVLDRISTRKLLLSAITICVIFTYLFSLSQTIFQAEICRFVTGIASTFCMLSCVRLASRWFPPNRIALVVGCVVTFAMLGGVVAQTPMMYSVHLFGWRHAVMINASLGVLFTFIIYRFVQDYPSNFALSQASEKRHLQEEGFLKSIRTVMKNSQNWVAGIYANLMSFPVIILGAAWGSMYLMQVRGLTHIQTSYVTTMIFVGTIMGSPILGWLSDKLELRKMPMVIGAVLTLIVMLMIVYLPVLSLSQLMVLFFLLGFISSTQVISFPVVVESNPLMMTTTAEGLACTLIMSAGLFQVVYGWLLDLGWDGQMSAGVRVYSAHSFSLATLIFPIAFGLSILLALLVKETHCRHHE